MQTIYGAPTETWTQYRESGWSSYMLPVVSNPNVEVSKNSSLKSLGKTPSQYNRSNKVIGIPSWTKLIVNDTMLDAWSQYDDYGICLRCGDVIAFDCDCDDEEISKGVQETFFDTFGKVPVRTRGGARWLAVLRVSSEMGKMRVLFSDNNMLEVLAKGQHFVAEGTHKSGSRYEWDAPLVFADLPVVGPNAVKDFLEYVNSVFGTEEKIQKGRVSNREVSETIVMTDPLADWLRKTGRVLSEDRGILYIKCPWESDHTPTDNADPTATAYFSAGSFGHKDAGFRCLHGHCESRTYGDFLKWAIEQGYTYIRSSDFDIIPEEVQDRVKEGYRTTLSYNITKTGDIKATLPTVAAALMLPEVCGYEIAYDSFTWDTVYRPFGSGADWKTLDDTACVVIRESLERDKRFTPISRDLFRDAISIVGGKNTIDSMCTYVASVPEWDGVERVETSLSVYCNAQDCEYTRASARYLWSSLMGRAVSVRGVKADITLVLVGAQGCRKSTFVETIASITDYYGNLSLADGEEKAIRLMRGKLVMEVPELAGMTKKDTSDLKRFLTLNTGSLVPKYKEFAVTYPRRCIFVMTTNETEFLSDPTGARRFAPVDVGMIDIDKLKEDLPQLWAEGLYRFRKYGIEFRDCERLAREIHHDYTLNDTWEASITKWIADQDCVTNGLPTTTANILLHAIGIPVARARTVDCRRVSQILRAIGYVQIVKKIENRSVRIWRLAQAPKS